MGAPPERLPTVLALERLFSSMYLKVGTEASSVAKTFATFFTLLWFLSRMYMKVNLQAGVVTKALATVLALVFP